MSQTPPRPAGHGEHATWHQYFIAHTPSSPPLPSQTSFDVFFKLNDRSLDDFFDAFSDDLPLVHPDVGSADNLEVWQPTAPLQTWFDAHQADPYPTKWQKTELQHESGLTRKQVAGWFNNERKRLRRGKCSPPRRRGLRTPKTCSTPLRTWFDAHHAHPYPTKRQKTELEQESGLTRKQVAQWFYNTRKRRRV